MGFAEGQEFIFAAKKRQQRSRFCRTRREEQTPGGAEQAGAEGQRAKAAGGKAEAKGKAEQAGGPERCGAAVPYPCAVAARAGGTSRAPAVHRGGPAPERTAGDATSPAARTDAANESLVPGADGAVRAATVRHSTAANSRAAECPHCPRVSEPHDADANATAATTVFKTAKAPPQRKGRVQRARCPG